jgi:ABC-type sugar transport system ATPase subunit
VSKWFGTTQALRDVSACFEGGEVHALMGENGAGKSTLGKIIAGLHAQDAGTITIDGREIPPGSIDSAFAAGVRIVHQELAQCPNLTVAENLCLHDLPRRRFRTVDRAMMRRRAALLLARIEPGIHPEATLGDLSPGHRQIVQIAAALDDRVAAGSGGRPGRAASAPRVIVFDEPTSSLSILETGRLQGIVRQLAADGLCIIYVSHRMSEIFACCDRVTVLRDGRYVATSRVGDIDEPALVEQMIGRRLDPTISARGRTEEAALEALGGGPHQPPADSAAVLEVRGLSSPGRLEDISLSVGRGEVVGIGGLVGSGRSEVLDAIFGLDKAATGQVLIGGKPLPMRRARAAVCAGVGYVPEDRRHQGLCFQLGVAENIVMPVMQRLSRGGVRRVGRECGLARMRMREFQIKAASPAASPGALSGGNQQKVVIARWMSPDVRVLLLDEPTRGIDVGTKAEIYRLIRATADRGAAIVLVSSEMPELLALSDRIIVLCEGKLAGELRGEAMTQAAILRLTAAVGERRETA